jgi:ornithine lipid ester-linked acyl 2-hydroxylase
VLLIDTKRPYSKIGERINNFVINSITNSIYVKDALKKNEDWEKMYYKVLA